MTMLLPVTEVDVEGNPWGGAAGVRSGSVVSFVEEPARGTVLLRLVGGFTQRIKADKLWLHLRGVL